jgi:hypothetical protein
LISQLNCLGQLPKQFFFKPIVFGRIIPIRISAGNIPSDFPGELFGYVILVGIHFPATICEGEEHAAFCLKQNTPRKRDAAENGSGNWVVN